VNRLLARVRRPPTTVRWRLTLLYGGLFLICGAGLLVITYTLVAHATRPGPGNVAFTRRPPRPNFPIQATGLQVPAGLPPSVVQALRSTAGKAVVRSVVVDQRVSDLHQLEIESGIALAIMALISGLLGWIVAGRVLRPLRTITTTTQQLSEVNLHERLALDGPRDELRTLADTIDGLLARLERAFDAQRRFATNASHELRTPLAASRALLEMAVSDPDATVASLRAACHGALEESEQQEQLIDALLALAQGERGLDIREPVDLAALTLEVQRVCEPTAATQGVGLDVEAGAVTVLGDRRLLGRVLTNLVENGIRYNVPAGRVEVHVANRGAEALVTVTNTGPVVPATEISRLLQPFQRVAPERVGQDGFGLGLSIVAAVASAHGAALDIRPGTEGGLRVELRFPQAAAPRPEEIASAVANDPHDHGPRGAPRRVEDEPQVGVG
jgi:signal transduction histidine kinase